MSDDWPKSNLFLPEEELSALLLAMVLQHCESPHSSGQLDSYAITANADAMICCAEDGYIELTAAAGRRICGVVTPDGHALLERLRVELEKDAAAQQAWIERVIRDRPAPQEAPPKSDNNPPPDNRTGADLIAALQASPHPEIDIEPERLK